MKKKLSDLVKEETRIKYKILYGKKAPLCDYHGECTNKAFKEVYPFLLGKKYENRGWNYLCRKHFEQEKKRFKGKLAYCSID